MTFSCGILGHGRATASVGQNTKMILLWLRGTS
jgi:hypothetical protein